MNFQFFFFFRILTAINNNREKKANEFYLRGFAIRSFVVIVVSIWFFFESKYFHENLHLICLTKSITEKLDREKKITDSLDRKETGEQNQTNKPDQTLWIFDIWKLNKPKCNGCGGGNWTKSNKPNVWQVKVEAKKKHKHKHTTEHPCK